MVRCAPRRAEFLLLVPGIAPRVVYQRLGEQTIQRLPENARIAGIGTARRAGDGIDHFLRTFLFPVERCWHRLYFTGSTPEPVVCERAAKT
jgi:hypothetical protein